MSRRSIFSKEKNEFIFEATQNINNGTVLNCVILEVCGAHKPVSSYVKLVTDDNGNPVEGFYESGIWFILYDINNKEIISTPWKKSYDELRTIYGVDENIIGRKINLHCISETGSGVLEGTITWEREDDILFQNESCQGYISLAGSASMVVNDYESQMKSFSSESIGKGRRWNRI